jgi:hypothetical protein
MTVREIAHALNLSDQGVRRVGKVRGWKPAKEGERGWGNGRLYYTADVLAEIDDRIALHHNEELDLYQQKRLILGRSE